MPRPSLTVALALAFSAVACAQERTNPFGPQQSVKLAPTRTFDLLDVDVTLRVDWPKRSFRGTAINTLRPLRPGLKELRLMAGEELTLSSVTLDGKPAKYRRDGRSLFVTVPPTKLGKTHRIAVSYASMAAKGGGFGSEGGFHWIEPNGDPARQGYWTQGETEYNSNWIPTWDYPNDLATSVTRVTVPKAWTVIGNGLKSLDKVEGNERTVVWRMTRPHATYLIASYAFPMDIKTASWRGKPLIYAVPKGLGGLIDDSFSDTPAMLDYFSKTFGVEYPWPKYAQVAAYDFGGGMENVSATILGAGSLTDRREGPRQMASLNSHELGHQWFGDLVTCKSWGHAWLNESWATYAQFSYFRHARGEQEYLRELTNGTAAYLGEARRYKRAIATDRYPNGDAMFDSHLYPKGAVVLHTLRKLVGDEPFWAGVKRYLDRNRHSPVETDQFRRAMIDATGVQLQPFFEQWILRPGHPVLNVTTKKTDGGLEVTIAQVQDRTDGTPLYDIPNAKIGLVRGGKLEIVPLALKRETTTATFADVDEIIVDPEHDYLREIRKQPWSRAGLLAVATVAPNGVDRTAALRLLAAAEPTDAERDAVIASLRADRSEFPAVEDLGILTGDLRPSTRAFLLEELTGPSNDRRIRAGAFLARFPLDPELIAAFDRVIRTDGDVFGIPAAVNALAASSDPKAIAAVERAAAIESRSGTIERAALPAIFQRDPARAVRTVAADFAKAGPARKIRILSALVEAPPNDPQATALLIDGVRDARDRVALAAVQTIAKRKERTASEALRRRATTAEIGLKKEIETTLAGLG